MRIRITESEGRVFGTQSVNCELAHGVFELQSEFGTVTKVPFSIVTTSRDGKTWSKLWIRIQSAHMHEGRPSIFSPSIEGAENVRNAINIDEIYKLAADAGVGTELTLELKGDSLIEVERRKIGTSGINPTIAKKAAEALKRITENKPAIKTENAADALRKRAAAAK